MRRMICAVIGCDIFVMLTRNRCEVARELCRCPVSINSRSVKDMRTSQSAFSFPDAHVSSLLYSGKSIVDASNRSFVRMNVEITDGMMY